jgi:cephalosporin hydroxylase
MMKNKVRMQGNSPTGATDWPEELKIQTEIDFHQLFYDSAETTWKTMRWMGVPIQKNPCDLWMYQQLLYKVRPDLIIETGTLYGGSALYLSHLSDILGHGHVVSIDITQRTRPLHQRLTYFNGNSVGIEARDFVAAMIKYRRCRTILVILDSDHEYEHVLHEMMLYSQFVTPGSYMIVEDTNLNGHPVWPEYGPGPLEAVNHFLHTRPDFERDIECERLMLTFNRGGYLRKLES